MNVNKHRIIGSLISPLIRSFVGIARLIRLNRLLRTLPSKYKFCQWLWQWTTYNSNFEMRGSSHQISGLKDLIIWIGDVKNLTLVEIGSYRGESARIFLDSGKFSRIYCVDPWENCYDVNDFAGFTNMKLAEKDFDERAGNDSRITKVKGTIETLVENYPELHPDVIYVDGCHTYDAVKNDLTISLNKLKPRLAICGHDFSDAFSGCREAIIETCGVPDKTFADTSWAKRIQRNV